MDTYPHNRSCRNVVRNDCRYLPKYARRQQRAANAAYRPPSPCCCDCAASELVTGLAQARPPMAACRRRCRLRCGCFAAGQVRGVGVPSPPPYGSSVFPDDATLIELGRIAVVSARMDGALARLLAKVDRRAVFEDARKWQTGKLIKHCRAVAGHVPANRGVSLLETLTAAETAQDNRHVVLHSEWIMVIDRTRGLDPRDVLQASEEQLAEWASDPAQPEWGTYNARTDATADAPTVKRLQEIVTALENATGRLHMRWVELPLRECWGDPG